MKKQIISLITAVTIFFILGLTDCVLATNQPIENEDTPITSEVTNVQEPGMTQNQDNTQWIGANSTPTDYINDINSQLQNIVSKQQPKDNRRAVAVTIIIIVTVALIAMLVTWYYMTNQ